MRLQSHRKARTINGTAYLHLSFEICKGFSFFFYKHGPLILIYLFCQVDRQITLFWGLKHHLMYNKSSMNFSRAFPYSFKYRPLIFINLFW